MDNDIYIELKKKIQIKTDTKIILKDIAEIDADASIKSDLENIQVYEIKILDKSVHSVTILDVIKVIKENYKDKRIESIGENQTIIEYLNDKKRPSGVWEFFKLAFVCLSVFVGTAVAIMTFHTDVAMPEVHKNIYKIFTGLTTERPLIIQIPYSIGLAAGVIVFFNHFRLKDKNYPTPIEIEISKYNEDLDKCTAEKIARKDNGENA